MKIKKYIKKNKDTRALFSLKSLSEWRTAKKVVVQKVTDRGPDWQYIFQKYANKEDYKKTGYSLDPLLDLIINLISRTNCLGYAASEFCKKVSTLQIYYFWPHFYLVLIAFSELYISARNQPFYPLRAKNDSCALKRNRLSCIVCEVLIRIIYFINQ